MSEKIKLNSHVLHPQIKSEHANAESAKLTNHDTAPSGATSTATAAPTSNNATSKPLGSLGDVTAKGTGGGFKPQLDSKGASTVASFFKSR